MSVDRVERAGKAPPAKLSWAIFRRVAKKWRKYSELKIKPMNSQADGFRMVRFHSGIRPVRLFLRRKQLLCYLA